MNPLFAPQDDPQAQSHQNEGYLLPKRHVGKIEPLNNMAAPHTPLPASESSNPAVELIRRKVAAIYAEEPDVKEELAASTQLIQPQQQRSPHQQFMHSLSTSGKSLAEIQTEWHNYYNKLSDTEKHAVWQEFYAANAHGHTSAYTQYAASQAATQTIQPATPAPVATLPAFPATPHASRVVVAEHTPPVEPAKPDKKPDSPSRLKKKILAQVAASSSAQAKAKQHFQSLLFGLGTGSVVLVVFLFGFFNEMIIAPFVQPSRHVSATPIIVSSDSVAPSDTPEIIIPKINVQIPVVYDQDSVKEEDVQAGLERGVIHYPTTVEPGQQGNAAFFGHSSNNIFNKGKYKFAFVLLRQLVPGDIFYLTYDKKVYSYRVFDKKVVAPSEVSVLGSVPGKPVTAALITCDPPGTSTNRLVVWGEQISPDPAAAPVPTTPSDGSTPVELPSEGPTMWKRFWDNIF